MTSLTDPTLLQRDEALYNEWLIADRAADFFAKALERKTRAHAAGTGEAPTLEDHARAFHLAAIASRAALAVLGNVPERSL